MKGDGGGSASTGSSGRQSTTRPPADRDADASAAPSEPGSGEPAASEPDESAGQAVSRSQSRDRDPRWRFPAATAATLVAIGLGTGRASVVAAAALPLAVVAYGALGRVPALRGHGTSATGGGGTPAPGGDGTSTPDGGGESATDEGPLSGGLAVERTVDAAGVGPGDAAAVALAVTNETGETLADVRVVDGVPPALAVGRGSPRAARSLRPGETATVEYAVVARRGTFQFGDPVIQVRSLPATGVVTVTPAASGDRELACVPAVEDPPLADATLPRSGTLPTDSGGSGIEFHATRDYQPGDPVARIDWRRYAKSGDLATVAYREQQATRTVLLVDARPVARVSLAPGHPSAADRGAHAAERLFAALDRRGVVASVAAVGLAEGDVPGGLDADGLRWVSPEGARAAAVFEGVHAASRRPPGTDGASDGPPAARPAAARPADDASAAPVEAVLSRLPPTAQVILVTPLLDDWPVDLAARLATRNYPTTIVSPDVTGGGTPGGDDLAGDLLGLERRLRVDAVEAAGGRVVDWRPDEPVDAALGRSMTALIHR